MAPSAKVLEAIVSIKHRYAGSGGKSAARRVLDARGFTDMAPPCKQRQGGHACSTKAEIVDLLHSVGHELGDGDILYVAQKAAQVKNAQLWSLLKLLYKGRPRSTEELIRRAEQLCRGV